LRLEQIKATVPVSTLRTGIGLRDEHMREYIFATPDKQMPDVTFAAPGADCARAGAAYTCAADGTLTIRGTARPFRIALDVARDGEAFRVKGSGKVALSAYGIERPSQFGVRTNDEVTIHLEFSARSPTSAAQAR
jgi:polyisoprenoid-binding protein YceI